MTVLNTPEKMKRVMIKYEFIQDCSAILRTSDGRLTTDFVSSITTVLPTEYQFPWYNNLTTGVTVYLRVRVGIDDTAHTTWSPPFIGEERTVHNTGISLLLSTSVWVILSPTTEHRETRPTAERPCPRTVWRKKVAQSSTLDQAVE